MTRRPTACFNAPIASPGASEAARGRRGGRVPVESRPGAVAGGSASSRWPVAFAWIRHNPAGALSVPAGVSECPFWPRTEDQGIVGDGFEHRGAALRPAGHAMSCPPPRASYASRMILTLKSAAPSGGRHSHHPGQATSCRRREGDLGIGQTVGKSKTKRRRREGDYGIKGLWDCANSRKQQDEEKAKRRGLWDYWIGGFRISRHASAGPCPALAFPSIRPIP